MSSACKATNSSNWGRASQLLANVFPCSQSQSQMSLGKLTRSSFLLVSKVAIIEIDKKEEKALGLLLEECHGTAISSRINNHSQGIKNYGHSHRT